MNKGHCTFGYQAGLLYAISMSHRLIFTIVYDGAVPIGFRNGLFAFLCSFSRSNLFDLLDDILDTTLISTNSPRNFRLSFEFIALSPIPWLSYLCFFIKIYNLPVGNARW